MRQLRSGLPRLLFLTCLLPVALATQPGAGAPRQDGAPVPAEPGAGPVEAPEFEAVLLSKARRGAPTDGFGIALAELGQRIGNSTVLVGAPCGGVDRAGYITVLSGERLRKQESVPGEVEGNGLGFSVAAGSDRNRDQVLEYYAGAPFEDSNTGSVELRGQKGKHVLRRIAPEYRNAQFGAAVLAPEDFDGDGVLDLVVGAPAFGGGQGRLDVLSGKNFDLLSTFEGRTRGDAFGSMLSAARDFNGDGKRDFIVGAPLGRRRTVPSGYVRVISGADFRILRSAYGQESMGLFGESAVAIDDLDGDDRPDLLVGAPSQSYGDIVDAGHVHLVSGKTGVLLRSWTGEADGEFFGRALASGFDLDGDGTEDFVVGAPQATVGDDLQLAGSVRLISGASGAELLRIDGGESGARFGASLLARETDKGLVLTIGAPARGRTLEVESGEGSTHKAVGTVYSYRITLVE